MPDYNPAIAAQVQPPQAPAQPNFAQTLMQASEIQRNKASQALAEAQALQSQRKYNGLMAFSQSLAHNGDTNAAYQAGLAGGADPQDLKNGLDSYSQAKFMQGHNNMDPQTFSSNASGLSSLASAARTQAEIPGTLADSATKVRTGAAQLAQEYTVNPTQDNRQAMIDYTRKYQGDDAAKKISGLSDQAFMNLATGHIGAGMTAEQATKQESTDATSQLSTPISRLRQSVGNTAAPPQAGQAQAGPTGGTQPVQPGLLGARPPMPPQQIEERKQLGEYLGKLPGKLADDANAAQQQNFTLDQMKRESASWDMGKGASTLMTAQQYLKPVANALGSTAFDKPVADYENFNKNAGTLVRQAVKEVSSRAAFQEMQLIQKSLPTSEGGLSRQGFNNIADQFGAVNDFKIAKQNAGQQYRQQNGTMDGFENQWTQNVSPNAFFVHRMSLDDLKTLATNLQKTPEGKAALNSIKQQITYANKNGLF